MCRRSDEVCPHCRLSYNDLRTGFTFNDIVQMLFSYDEDSSTWRYRRRNTILGKWHQIKQEFWKEHIKQCASVVELVEQFPAETPEAWMINAMIPDSSTLLMAEVPF